MRYEQDQEIEPLLKPYKKLKDNRLAESYIKATCNPTDKIFSFPKGAVEKGLINPALSLGNDIMQAITVWEKNMLPTAENLLTHYYETLISEGVFDDDLEELGELNEYDLELINLRNDFDVERLNLFSNVTDEEKELMEIFGKKPNSFLTFGQKNDIDKESEGEKNIYKPS